MTFTPGAGRILVMDDEPVVREVLRDLLVLLGYEVDAVNEGKKALDRYRAAIEEGQPYDVVILDLTVPDGMGGRETLAQLLSFDPQVKTIAISGHSDVPNVAEYAELGFSATAFKPFDMQALSETLATLTR